MTRPFPGKAKVVCFRLRSVRSRIMLYAFSFLSDTGMPLRKS